jgi:hypothetical protein
MFRNRFHIFSHGKDNTFLLQLFQLYGKFSLIFVNIAIKGSKFARNDDVCAFVCTKSTKIVSLHKYRII